jgi:hypothetical protein
MSKVRSFASLSRTMLISGLPHLNSGREVRPSNVIKEFGQRPTECALPASIWRQIIALQINDGPQVDRNSALPS